jgi:hypothetical protein
MTFVLAAITAIVILLTLLMIRRIQIAIACLKVAAAAVATMPSLMFFPLITFASFLCLFIYWVIIFAYQWSAGTIMEVHREPTANKQFTLSWMYPAGVANSSSVASSNISAAVPTVANGRVPCYEDLDCYYSVDFSQEQQVCLYAQRQPRHALRACTCAVYMLAATHELLRALRRPRKIWDQFFLEPLQVLVSKPGQPYRIAQMLWQIKKAAQFWEQVVQTIDWPRQSAPACDGHDRQHVLEQLYLWCRVTLPTTSLACCGPTSSSSGLAT